VVVVVVLVVEVDVELVSSVIGKNFPPRATN